MEDTGYTQWSLIDEVSSDLIYYGLPNHFQGDLNPKCAIMRVSKSGTVTTRMWADGNMARTQNWDDRFGLTYKFLQ